MKKQSGDFGSHKKSLQDYISFSRASDWLPDSDENDNKLSSIITKAQAGKKLSAEEWEYLRAKNPTLYEKLREVEAEAEHYEEALKRCKTRNEAQRLHLSKLSELMTAVKNGDSGALFRLNRLTQTMTEYTASEAYQKLPTEEEQAVEREHIRRAEQEEQLQEAAQRKEEREKAEPAPEQADTAEAPAGAEEEQAEAETLSKEAEGRKEQNPAVSPKLPKAGRASGTPKAERADAARAAEKHRAAPHPHAAAHSRRPEVPEGRGAGTAASPSPLSFVAKEYLKQQEGASAAQTKRRAFHSEA